MNFKRLIPFALLCASAYGQNAHPLTSPMWQFVDETGAPCVGCKVYSYLAGTTTQTPTYTDYLEVSQNTNPIILNAAGQAQIWVGTPTLKLVLKHADGSLIWTVDHIPTWGTGGGGSGCTTVGAGGVIQASDGAGGCAAAHVQVNGLNLLQDTTPNFVDTPGVQFQNPSGNQITATGTVIRVNDVATTPVSPVNLNDTLPLPDTGYINAKVRQDGSANVSFEVPATTPPDITPLVTAPVPGQYVILRPHRFTITRRDFAPGSIVGSADGSNGSGTIVMGSTCSLSYTNIGTWDQYSLADYGIDPANVTAVYAFGVSGISAVDTNNFCYPTLADPNWASTTLFSGAASLALPASQPSKTQQTTGATGFTGAQVATATTVAQMTVTGATRLNTVYNIDSVGLIVYYTGTPVTSPNRLYVSAPINYDSNTRSLYLDPLFPQQLNGYILGTEPYAGNFYGSSILIYGTTDCVTPGGFDDEVLCKPHNTIGSTFVWAPMTGGGGGSGTVTSVATGSGLNGGTITTSGTVACNTASSSVVGCVKVDGTTITASGGVISAVGGGSIGGSGTAGYYALWSASTTLGNGSLDDAVTTAGFVTSSKAFQVVCSTCATQASLTYNSGHAPSVGSATTAVLAPDASGNLDISEAGAAFDRVCTHSNGQCTGGGGGSYTNVTGSASETTVALINTACGSGTYYATTALSIATGGTITCPVQFSKAGLWTIASGQTVTFAKAITETDAPAQHFAGSGTAVLAATQAEAVIDWWGAVNYTTQAGAISGTDSTTAIQACITAMQSGQCFIPQGYYRITSAISIAKSSVGLAGVGSYPPNLASPIQLTASQPSNIVSTSASADMIVVAGTGINSVVSGNKFNDFGLERSTVPTGTAVGLSLKYAWGAEVNRLTIQDSIYDIYVLYSNFWGSGGINNVTCLFGYNGFNETTGSVYGIYFDGANGDISANLNYTNISSGGSVTATSYGVYATLAVDLMTDNVQTFQTTYGIYVTGNSQDAHFLNSILDSCSTACIFTTGINKNTTFSGGWVQNTSGAYGADIESSFGVALIGIQFLLSGSTAAIRTNASGGIIIANNTIQPRNSADGIDINATTSGTTTISGNTIFGNGTSPATLIKLTNASNNSIQGNALATATTGISADSSSNHNHYINLNSIDASGSVTTAISDAGSDNQSTGFTNPMTTLGDTMYGGASGALTRLAGPTTTAHQFLFGDVPVSSAAVAPAWFDLGANLGTYVKATSPIVATQNANDVTLSCPTCGTSSATNVTINGGSGLGTANFNGTTPAAGSNGKNVTWQVSSSNVSAEIVGDGNAAHYLDGTGAYSTPAGGGGSGFPFTIVQIGQEAFGSATSFTYTFPAALQGSGATAMLIFGTDASGAFTAPAGWTCSVEIHNGTNYPRLEVCIIASAGQTSVSFSVANATSPTVRFYEFSGTRTFDITTGTSYTASAPLVINMPSITPTSGAAVFAMCTLVEPSTSLVVGGSPLGSPDWIPADVYAPLSTGRVLYGAFYNHASNGSAIQPPQFSPIAPFSSSGVSCATFSIK